MGAVHKGACFCGVVELELAGNPKAMGYCHCASCRAWSGDPIHTWTVWGADSVMIIAGSEYVASFLKSSKSLSHRQFCTKCGGHLMISHPTLGLIDVLRGVIPKLNFVPSMHINYGETIFPVDDELPKFKDFPSEFGAFGGTGELMPP